MPGYSHGHHSHDGSHFHSHSHQPSSLSQQQRQPCAFTKMKRKGAAEKDTCPCKQISTSQKGFSEGKPYALKVSPQKLWRMSCTCFQDLEEKVPALLACRNSAAMLRLIAMPRCDRETHPQHSLYSSWLQGPLAFSSCLSLLPSHFAPKVLAFYCRGTQYFFQYFADGAMEKGLAGERRGAVPRPKAESSKKNSVIDDKLLPVPSTGRSPPSSVGRAQGP